MPEKVEFSLPFSYPEIELGRVSAIAEALSLSGAVMDLFVTNDEVAALQSQLVQVDADGRLQVLVRLAWALRQSDSRNAMQLIEQLQNLLGSVELDPFHAQAIQARLILIRAEHAWLFAQLGEAESQAQAALQTFTEIGDALGVGDAAWLLASIHHERGAMRRRDACLEEAIEAYRSGDDQMRVDAARARLLERRAFRDPGGTAALLDNYFHADQRYSHQVMVWIASARGIVARLTGDPVTAIRYFSLAQQSAQESGQLRQSILAASNGADAFASLGDLDAALEWIERALALAQGTGWPGMVGACLIQSGNVLRLLGRYADASRVLHEALTVMDPLINASSYAIALQYLGELALDVNEPLTALEYFNQTEERASALDEPIFVLRCWRGQASALCRLALPDQAEEKLASALALAKQEGSADEQIKVLLAYAELRSEYLRPQSGMVASQNAALFFLKQALEVAGSIQAYIVPAELYDALAIAYAASGDYQQAYSNAQAAARARAHLSMLDAHNRAIAIQVRQETAQAHSEALHQRALAETEARRALALQEAGVTLETLGQIGREITASLNADAVFSSMHSHLNQLLDATSFFVYLLSADGQELNGVVSIEAGQNYIPRQFSIHHPTSFTARCARERQEVLIEIAPEEARPNLFVGSLDTVSLLFSPLLIGERLLGVMSIQSVQEHAYGERERSVFRTLCAYAAIALDNAAAYALAEDAQHQANQALVELHRTQEQLVQAEKMAALGRLVAGVSHELNTPLGNGLMAISTLTEQLDEFEQGIAAGGLRRHSFEMFLNNVRQASNIVQRNLQRSANLIHSFKQVAVEREGLQRQKFLLSELIGVVQAEATKQITDSACKLELRAFPDLLLDSFPEVLANVLQRLIENAVVHGFAQRAYGRIWIECEALASTGVSILIADDGCGIAAEFLTKVFDPFFTTRLGQGSSGLGLHIAHNAVTQILGGSLSVHSRFGEGARFSVIVPLVAP